MLTEREGVRNGVCMKRLFQFALLGTLIGFSPVGATELTWKFKNPAFHYGNGYSTHVLSVEQLQHNRKQELRKEAEAEAARIERELENSVLNKFIRNLESRIYAQMAKQMVESMFSNDGSVRYGSFTLEGNVVTYEVITNEDGSEVIRMTIVDTDGTETVIEIPVGTGNFGQDPDG